MAALRRLNRKQRRAGAELLTGSRAYIRAAAESLGFSDEQLAEAQSGAGEAADMLMARVFELLELQHGHVTPDCEQARAEMEQRRGRGFVQRVARMGRPATAALSALRGLLVLVLLLLWPTTAKAAANHLAGAIENAHKIQRRNRRKIATVNRRSYHHPRGWIQSKLSYGRSLRRSLSASAFATGCACAPGSYVSRARARTSRSFSFGDVAPSEWAASLKASRTSPFVAETALSSSRRTPSRAGVL
jgi:hypothetical protein